MINPVHGHLQRRIAASLIPKRPRIRVGAEGLETHQGWHNQVSGAQSGSAPLPPTTIGRKVAKVIKKGNSGEVHYFEHSSGQVAGVKFLPS